MSKEVDSVLGIYVCAMPSEEHNPIEVRGEAQRIGCDLLEPLGYGYDACRSRIAFFNFGDESGVGKPTIEEMVKHRDLLIAELKEKLPAGYDVKCFITLDWGMGLIFPLDHHNGELAERLPEPEYHQAEGNDYLNRFDYGDFLQETALIKDEGGIVLEAFRKAVKPTKIIKGIAE